MNNFDLDNITIKELTTTLKLNQEEQDLLNSIENDEWVNISTENEEIQHLQTIAKNQLAKRTIKLEMSMEDTEKIYNLAAQLEQSVSSLVQDVVHKYLQGQLVEKT